MTLTEKRCVPCEGGTSPLTDAQKNALLAETPEWTLHNDGTHRITREFTFKDFAAALQFVNRVGDLAESEGHHPNIEIHYNKVELELFTHATNGLSENDFILAAKIDQIS